MAWQDQMERLGLAAQARVRRLWDRHVAGDLDESEFVTLAAALIALSKQTATAAADVAVSVDVARRTGRPPQPVGLVEPDETGRLRGAVDTVIHDRPVTVPEELLAVSVGDRLGRLARSETLTSAQTATQTRYETSGVADRWVRKTDSDPCPVCVAWADGVPRSWDVRMNRHPNCACIPVPESTSDAPRRPSTAKQFLSDLADDIAAAETSDKPSLEEVLADLESRGFVVTGGSMPRKP